jgi:hypothetical protein
MFKDGLLAVALSILCLGLSGCGGNGDQPELGLVTGTVTLDGKPLYGTAVVFYPDNGRPARGRTDLNGKYELTYIRQTLGTKVGHNRVEVAPDEEGEEDAEELENSGENTGPAKQPRDREKIRIPARYNTKSTLQADVKPGENVFDFQLESKPSAE